MDPAFPDLVAAVAAEEMEERRPRYASPSCRDAPEALLPEILADALRFLARLW